METTDEHSGAHIDINLDAVAYLYPGQHGSTVYFAVTDASGKFVSLSVKETPDSVHAAPSLGTATASAAAMSPSPSAPA